MFPCLHRWSNWSTPYTDDYGHAGKLLQARKCTRCGKVRIGRVQEPFLSRTPLPELLRRLYPETRP